MTRIFPTLAAVNALALVATYVLGWWSKLTGGQHSPDGTVFLLHFLFGLFSGVGTLLVHCLIFTYFLGTGRWVKEVGLAYDLPDDGAPKRTRELKRLTFPPALNAMLLTIAAAATGAGVQLQGWPWYLHFTLATVALLANFWAYVIEFTAVNENAAILNWVMADVERIRAAKGLPSNAEALAELEGRPSA